MLKKQPLRQCTGCGEMKPKAELDRIVKTPSGEILIDKTNKVSGRGAYICKNPKCLNKARKSKRIETSLEISIPDDVYLKMEEELTLGG